MRSSDNLADALTKPLAAPTLLHIRLLMGISEGDGGLQDRGGVLKEPIPQVDQA